MVRKWSYLTKYITTKSKNIKLTPILPRLHVLKVFKSKTRFKKAYFNIKTRYYRLKYRRRKHKSNWLTYSIILYFWVTYFLKYKQFVRFYQNLGLLNYQFHSSTTNLMSKVSLRAQSLLVYNSYSCSQNLLKNFMSKLINIKLPLIQYSGVLFNSKNDITSAGILNPGLLFYENSFYSYDIDDDKLLNSDDYNSSTQLIYSNMVQCGWFSTSKYLMCCYFIILLLSLKNINIKS